MTGSAPQRWTLHVGAGGSSEGRESEGGEWVRDFAGPRDLADFFPGGRRSRL